eukprot:CAMPEP_0194386534 /NCGR_PEP_ID=MMETSP0174-20130528/86950_1 /TAXON_ID=216777 /ORGANISM="Proboscia alata, Strain PI-D3" /LENGTH=461 /DNA_ID=CAMNT_0039175807 /DNA_START=163 /DNA_END=1544 /DNA_ORIENTATION=-
MHERRYTLTLLLLIFLIIKIYTEVAQTNVYLPTNDLYHADNNPIIKERKKYAFEATNIRKWGCNRTDTPFIFIHIGKAGGGSHRARFAASSVNYNKSAWHSNDESYYPIRNDAGYIVTRAQFCNSGSANFLPNGAEKTFEGTRQCSATTPIGQAIACPGDLNQCEKSSVCKSDSCPIVYVGHNKLGSELHWLPSEYLTKWWSETWSNEIANDPIKSHFKSLSGIWCQNEQVIRPKKRPLNGKIYKSLVDKCSVPLANHVDEDVFKIFGNEEVNWSKLYASLPVLRVIVVREPFSWLVSKFFWHHQRLAFSRSPTFTCGNIEQAIARIESRYESVDIGGIGWATQFSMNYMFYLCGEECLVRWKSGMINLPEVEQQAEHNLRNSFAVVGLLNETEEFYEMISNRIQYMDTSLNKHVVGSKHNFSNIGIITECQVLYQDPAFQKQLLNLSDEIAALNRLFKVA